MHNVLGKIRKVLGIRLVGVGLGLLTSIIYANILTLNAFGTYAIFVTALQISCVFAKFGFDTLILREIPSKLSQEKDFSYGFGLIFTALFFSLIGSIAINAIFSCLVFIFGTERLLIDRNGFYFVLALQITLCLLQILAAITHSLGRQVIADFVQSLFLPAASLIATLILIFVGGLDGISGALGGYLAGSIVCCSVLVYLSYKEIYSRSCFPRFTCFTWIVRSSHFFLSSISGTVITTADIIIIGISFGPEAAGKYRVASRIARLLVLPVQAMNTVISPELSRLMDQGALKDVKALIKSSTLRTFAFSSAMFIMITLVKNDLLGLYGKEYLEASSILFILMCGTLANSFFGPVGSILNMSGFGAIVAQTLSLMAVMYVFSLIAASFLHSTIFIAVITAFFSFAWNISLRYFCKSKIGIVGGFI